MTALAVVLACGAAKAQQVNVKIGVLSDMSSLYADIGGPGSVAAAKLAIADFTKANPNVKVELISGDHQNKPDVGSSSPTSGIDVDKVDMIIDMPNSGVALAVSQVAASKNKMFIVSGAAASDLTGPKCNANTMHWTYDTWMLANGTGKAHGEDRRRHLVLPHRRLCLRPCARARHRGGGREERRQGARQGAPSAQHQRLLVVPAAGAVVEGQDHRPRQCRRRHHQLDQAGAEFGIVKGGQKFAGLLVFASDVNALGLPTAQGLTLTETWYWDMNDANRAWTKRWQAERNAAGKFPTMVQAGVYSGITHYLKAVVALKSAADGKAVVAKMKKMPTDDPLFGKGTIRADGRKLHDAYLFEVKNAGGIEVSRRLLQAEGHHPGGGGVPSAQGRRLPAGERLI